MSDYERNKGKLIPFELTEELAKELVESNSGDEGYGSYVEQVADDLYYYFSDSVVKISDKFYKVLFEVQSEFDSDPTFAEAVKNPDGSIDFHTYHYNGGAHWTEVVEDALNEKE